MDHQLQQLTTTLAWVQDSLRRTIDLNERKAQHALDAQNRREEREMQDMVVQVERRLGELVDAIEDGVDSMIASRDALDQEQLALLTTLWAVFPLLRTSQDGSGQLRELLRELELALDD